MLITDKEVNDIISELLDTTHIKRVESGGQWAAAFDKAMAQWCEMHPGTNPPCWVKVGAPPSCFTGDVPPIYGGPLGEKFVACN